MPIALQEMLSALTKSKIDLTINQNKSTMISILERRRKYAKLSVRQMFLEAPNNVIEAIVLLLKNKNKMIAKSKVYQAFDQDLLDKI